jgi:alanyl-tRNA synthetase
MPLLAETVVKEYHLTYPELHTHRERIISELQKEEERFEKTLEKGLREFSKMAKKGAIDGVGAFLLFQSYGFPLEMTEELADEQGIPVDTEGFFAEFQKHQKLSKKGAEKKFKGGLADLSPETIKLHTATHLLNEALRRVIDRNIAQRGSNITPERLRFDFSFDRKLTPDELKAVEDEVNRVIQQGLDVVRKEMPKEEAAKIGAQMEFGQKYPDVVSVYCIGDYSKEFCGGPHVKNTKEIGHFKIVKEQSVAAGVRRIKAVIREEPEK